MNSMTVVGILMILLTRKSEECYDFRRFSVPKRVPERSRDLWVNFNRFEARFGGRNGSGNR